MVKNKQLFLFLLISSIGSWLFWLALGPYISTNFNGSSDLGLMGLIRQLSLFIGVILGTTILDAKHDLKQAILTEFLTVIIGLFILLSILNSLNLYIIFVLSGARFFLSGCSFMFTFSSFSRALSSKGNSIIVHLLSTQGAVVFASIIGLLFFEDDKNTVILAICLDIISSLALVIYMNKTLNSSSERIVIPGLSSINAKIKDNWHRSATSIWKKELYPWNILYLFSMFGISGLAVISDEVGDGFSNSLNIQGFSVAILFYGVSLWLTGYIFIKKELYSKKDFFASLMILLFAATFNIQGHENIAFVLYVLAFGFILNGLNKKIITMVDVGEVGHLRGSLGFYLTTIFALMEYIYGSMLLPNLGIRGVGEFQFISCVLMLIFLGISNVKK